MSNPDSHVIGIISDTHGLVRPSAIKALEGSDLVIHAGDIGKRGVIEALEVIAPVVAVRGNVDRDDWVDGLSESEVVEIGEVSLYVLHELSKLDLDPAAAGFSAVISGHSHRPSLNKKNGVYFLNPGSAGPRRFRLPLSVAQLQIKGNTLKVRLIELEV